MVLKKTKMCGIFTIINKNFENREILNADLDFAIKELSHRGPDDAGVWISDNNKLGMAHTRLSIIDLSNAGHQPMLSEDGRFVICFNGEIYNYLELRKILF